MHARTFILIFVIIFTTNIFAQYGIKELPIYQNHRLVRLDYRNKSGEKAVTNFEYNDDGFISKAIWQMNDNSRLGIVTYKYDESGKIIEKNRVFSDGVTIDQSFEYDQSSNLIIDNFERSDGTTGKAEYLYEKNGKLLKANCNKQNGWFSGKILFQYNEDGVLVKGIIYQKEEVVGKISYDYNQDGLLIKEQWDFPDIWSQTFVYIYKNILIKGIDTFFEQHIITDETPQVFAPNVISKGFHELGITISNSIDEIFYIMSDRNYQHYSLINMKKINNSWTKPEIADFALDKSVYTCFFSPDSKGLYFSTNRSIVFNADTLTGTNNWFVEKKENKWQEPKLINKYFDKGKSDRIHSISELKNIYLTREVSNSKTDDIFVSRFIDGKFQYPQPINGIVNTEFGEGRPFIAPDESYLIFQSDRPGGFGSNDLWISYCESGIWEEPVNLGNQINTEASEFAPYISPDGKYLFFSSYRSLKNTEIINKNYDELIELYSSSKNGYATLYRISSEIIQSLKKNSKN